MSRRRRREREPGRVRKTVEVLVSGLFGMAVVGVVVALLQSGASPSPSPSPAATVSDRSFPGDGANGGPVSVRSADPGTVETTGQVNAAATGTIPSSPAQGAQGAQATGQTEPADPTTSATQSSGTAKSSASASSSSTATASSTASSSGGGLGGLVGGVVGGVLGLL
ncbi:hypothetical protein KDK95_14355 [Actinospica sp. MGRD01-02]|uniref:Uncharacterized protein n=1 Tax=Actinospica acidithermotolerans TaxID=2828514 RepID=A0A941EBP5_9ACTN|nr:hypothetical protein [Actinospica acidithermotolerans]MBR7827497.1 hypothetical protein [Actinospica acidithermotolerans]